MRRSLLLVALAVLASVVLVGTPAAAPPTPKGDITAVLAGTGIKVSSTAVPPGSSGDVTVSLADCASGQVLKSGGPGTWSCAADATAAGSTGNAEVATEETTSATTCSDLATPGPSVTVDAPKGLISIYAQVEGAGFVAGAGTDTARGGWFACVQVGANPPVQAILRSSCPAFSASPCENLPVFETMETAPGTGGSGAVVRPEWLQGGWLALPVSGAGPHTVTLKYGCTETLDASFTTIPCDASHTATFRNRKLWVMGLG
jgi:hypothetical protein